MTAGEEVLFRWGPYVEAVDCDLCGDLMSGCPFHPDDDLADRWVAGFRRWVHHLLWDDRARRRAASS